MGHGHKVSCVLCQRSEETKITGPLSTKDQVTAHQNCLLFSSGIYCRDSPEFDDLFGFSVDDVRDEVKRGSKLVCNSCKKKGATAGCEIKRCKKSYHYPCAVQEEAGTVEDADTGKYALYCSKHFQQRQEKNNGINGHGTSRDSSEAGPSKVYCLTCEKTEGNISLESLSNSITILYCDKHAPRSHKKNMNGDSTGAGPSAYSSDSNSSNSTKRSCSKRPHLSDRQEETSSKRKSELWKRRIIEDSSDSDNNAPDSDMAIFAPLESDIDASANSVLESQFPPVSTVCQSIRTHTENPTGSPSGNPLEDEIKEKNKEDDDETDAESESLLTPVKISLSHSLLATSATLTTQAVSTAHRTLPKRKDEGPSPARSLVHSPDRHIAGPSAPLQTSTRPPSSPDHSKPPSMTNSPPCTSSALSPASPEPICVSLLSSPASPPVLPSDPEPSIDSTSFWKSCNVAGCTQAIFTDFINEMTEISSRIQSDQASREDYDLALKVMEASGKLAELVTKQQEELQRKQMELEQATAAMKKVASALRR